MASMCRIDCLLTIVSLWCAPVLAVSTRRQPARHSACRPACMQGHGLQPPVSMDAVHNLNRLNSIRPLRSHVPCPCPPPKGNDYAEPATRTPVLQLRAD